MAKRSFQLTGQKLLIVEGIDDERFFRALLRHLKLSGIQIWAAGGKTRFRPNLRNLVIMPHFAALTSLGIVRDADQSAQNTARSIQDALRAAGLPVPAQVIKPSGTHPQVSMFLMPGGGQPGTLEDLCLNSVAGTPTMSCVDQYFDCLKASGRIIPPLQQSKAKIQAYLAGQPKPGRRLGEAAQAGNWPWDNPAFDDVKQFLSLL